MSWDAWAEVECGGAEPLRSCDWVNFTHNMNAALDDALRRTPSLCRGPRNHFRDLDSMRCSAAALLLRGIQRELRNPNNSERYRAMEPSNNWGSLAGAERFVQRCIDICAAYPVATFRLCG